MRARQVRHLVRRPIRLFRIGPETDRLRPSRRGRAANDGATFFFPREKKTRFDSRAEKPSRGAAAFAAAEGRAP